MPSFETVCGECGATNEESEYCPDCGAHDSWEEQLTYDVRREVDLPLVFGVEHYDDTFKMWYSFTHAVFGQRVESSEVANSPVDPMDMKYCVVTTYYKITEGGSIEGPFLSREEARDA